MLDPRSLPLAPSSASITADLDALLATWASVAPCHEVERDVGHDSIWVRLQQAPAASGACQDLVSPLDRPVEATGNLSFRMTENHLGSSLVDISIPFDTSHVEVVDPDLPRPTLRQVLDRIPFSAPPLFLVSVNPQGDSQILVRSVAQLRADAAHVAAIRAAGPFADVPREIPLPPISRMPDMLAVTRGHPGAPEDLAVLEALAAEAEAGADRLLTVAERDAVQRVLSSATPPP